MAYVPKYGGVLPAPFPLQFPNSTVSHYSMAVVLIEHLSNDGLNTVVSHGTGFVWRHGTTYWLISARHVFSGTNPFDDTVISEMGYIPQRVRVHFGVGDEREARGRIIHEFELEQSGQANWIEDPDFASLRTDIAALPINLNRDDLLCLNGYPDFGEHDHLFSHVGLQCFVIGYPTTAVEGFEAPIWRSGSFASDPGLPIDGKPIFLVDASTGPGFSGAPVFRVHIGPAPFVDLTNPANISIDTSAVMRTSFIGVYAGRLNHPHIGAQTPYVFYANRIPILLSVNPSPVPLQPIT